MQRELDLLLGTAINSLAKLEALLYLQARAGGVHTPAELSQHFRRPVPEVSRALEELSQAGLVERFSLGSGKHVMYGSTEDAHVQELLGLLSEQYSSDPDTRSRIVRQAARARGSEESPTPADSL